MLSSVTQTNLIPVVAEVDLIVVGGTSAAVSFALAAKKAGASVYVISPKPYFGEDICAAYRFWPDRAEGNELANAIFASGKQPPTPMHVKLTLEQRLIAQDIPFLFNCFTAGLLRADSGQVCGVAIANRSGHQAIKARLVVDATMDGGVLEQAGHTELHTLHGKQTVHYVTLCEGEGRDAQDVEKVEQLHGYESDEYALSARRYALTEDFGDGSAKARADATNGIFMRCWVAEEYRHQTLIYATREQSAAVPNMDDLHVETGLLALTEAAKLPNGSEYTFTNPITAMTVAEHIGNDILAHLPARNDANLRVACHGAGNITRGAIRTLTDALRPGANAQSQVAFDTTQLPLLSHYDVVIAGGGTGGAPAAISAARAGAKTLVVEATSGLGGVGTMGQIANYWRGNRVGFTAEIDKGVKKLEHKAHLINDEDSWSVSAKCAWYLKAGLTEGCTYWFNTLCVGTLVEGDRVTGIVVAGPYGYGLVKAGCIVDSTGCADIPAAAGAPTAVIGKDHIAVQGTGLAGIKPGREYHNSDHNFSDDTDIVDATAFLVSSKLKFKDEFDCGELVDSRERRQIIGDFAITPVDILFARRFPDTICVATSNFDSHGFTVDPVFMLIPPTKKDALWADIPLRCLLPQGLDGVLVTGLGLSAHRDALPVIRMQADVQNQGYAAGYIAALSAQSGTPLRSLDIAAIQSHLVKIGGLPERVLTDEDSFPVSIETLEKAVNDDWDNNAGVSLMLYEHQRSPTIIQQAYAKIQGDRTPQSLRYAQVLALLGDATGQQELIDAITHRAWDKGWQFRGMHQFGMNMSELDSLLVCLGQAGNAAAWPCILEKIASLPEETEFSHCRAITMACEQLYPRHPHPDAAPAIAKLLTRPNYRGHAHVNLQVAQASITQDINENQVRDLALREIHLARALYRCGDCDGIAQAILNAYRHDYRGHFARHASAILQAV